MKRLFCIMCVIICALLVLLIISSSNDSRRLKAQLPPISHNQQSSPRAISLEDMLMAAKEANCDNDENFALTKNNECSQHYADLQIATNRGIGTAVDFRRVILIVSFNEPHFEAIPKVYRLYHGLFQKIILCVTGVHLLQNYHNGLYAKLVNVSIIELTREPTFPHGQSFYTCIYKTLDSLPAVRQLVHKEQTDGFLHISDDLIANLWSMKRTTLSLQNNWLLGPPQALYDIDRNTFCEGGSGDNFLDCIREEIWPILWKYQKPIQETYAEAALFHSDFLKSLADVSKGSRRVWNIYSDLFYISRRYLFKIAEIFRLFGKHDVWMELTVGTVFKSVTKPWQLAFLNRSGQIYGPLRDKPVTETYSPSYEIYHPLKLGSIQNASVDRQCLYCALVKSFDIIREKQRLG